MTFVRHGRRILLLAAALIAAHCPAQTTAPATQASTSAAGEGLKIAYAYSGESATVARLDNGLTVILKSMPGVGVVSVQAHVRTGGIYEGPWLGTGISHLTEHLVAMGAEHDMGQATAAEVRQTTGRVEEIGGQANAYTSSDSTVYYISAAAGKTAECVDLVADWMIAPGFTEQDFTREHGVVQRELEMGKDEPDRQMWQAHLQNVFGQHPVAVPVIGYAPALAGLTYRDVLDYHAKMYVPQNMVLAVVGDIDVEAVLAQVRRKFAAMPAGRWVDHTLPQVQPLSGVRRVNAVNAAIKDVMEQVSFITIDLLHEDLYALDLLSTILTQGRSSLLVEQLERRRQLVTAIDSSSWTPPWGRGAFSVQFRCEDGKADAAEKALLEQLETLKDRGVTQQDLQRAKRQKLAELVYSQQTAESQARTAASDFQATGDVDFSRRYTERIQQVTAEQVQEAARKYLTPQAMAVTRMTPARELATLPAAQTRPAEAQKAEVFKLENGLTVILQPTDVELVAMALVSKGGLLLEKPQTNGMGSLMAALATRGAGELTAQQIAEFFDSAGGAVAGNCGNNSFFWQATVLADRSERAVEIFADIITRPTFSQEELDRLKPVIKARVQQAQEQWDSQLQKYFRSKFFLDSPYSMLPIGAEEVIDRATPADIADWHKRHVLGGSSVLAIYGKIDPPSLRATVQRLFSRMNAGQAALELPPARTVPAEGELHVLKTEGQVAAIAVARPGMLLTELNDRIPMDVLDTIISGYHMPGGWLHNELRGKRLVYVVHAINFAGLAPGAFQVYAAGQPENASRIIQIIKDNLARAAAYQPSPAELDRAVNTILTAELLLNQEVSDLALAAGLDELYGFGYDYRSRKEQLYRKVAAADVLRVAKKYLSGGLVVVVTTPQPQLLTDMPQD